MADEIVVKVKKINPNAVIPTYAHDGDIGMDLTAISVEYNEEKDAYIYHTGLAFESDKNYSQFLFVRSSNYKTDCYLANHVGIGDSPTYRGEIMLIFKNRTSLKTMQSLKAQEAKIKLITTNIEFASSLTAQDFDSSERVAAEQVLEDARNLKFAPYDVGSKIGQMVMCHVPTTKLVEVDTLSDTVRGSGGFGSTGK